MKVRACFSQVSLGWAIDELDSEDFQTQETTPDRDRESGVVFTDTESRRLFSRRESRAILRAGRRSNSGRAELNSR